ncbi:MAG: hypothetical protein RQ756_03870, partial [Flavobacteriaceae bacterium]|nr:hypothetical protein [Flavobacteriaceae bacterium]
MKKIALIFLITVGLISCDETDPVIFDGSQTLVFFPNQSANLDVTIDDVGSVDIPINVTSLADVDRTVTVEVDMENTTADPQNFSFASNTVTIPANEFTGTL